MRFRFLGLLGVGLVGVLPLPSFVASCVPTTTNPYPVDAGEDATGGAGGSGGSGGSGLGGGSTDPTIGGPCQTDDDCDDALGCTFDACDLLIEKCRFTPDDAVCSNGKYCDGIERCDQKLGCSFG